MAPPWTTNPAPKTESAREARKAFYCDLCQKGYSRINEFEAHEGSYDHTHRKRLKDLKLLTRASDPTASARARRADEKASADAIGGGGPISIKPIGVAGGVGVGGGIVGLGEKKTGFKKGGFKNAFSAAAAAGGGGGGEGGEEEEEERRKGGDGGGRAGEEGGGRMGIRGEAGGEDEEGEEDDKRWGDYDPNRPTGCGVWCKGYGGS